MSDFDVEECKKYWRIAQREISRLRAVIDTAEEELEHWKEERDRMAMLLGTKGRGMIEYGKGDIFAQDVAAIVNPVNCIGVMGAGLALQFKTRFPDYFAAYSLDCARGLMAWGDVRVFDRGEGLFPRYLVSLATKFHWKDCSVLGFIQRGLRLLAEEIEAHRMESIAIPALGCGLGGLDWGDVREEIERELAGVEDTKIIVLEPR